MGSQRAGHDWTTCTFLGPMWGISWIVHIIACLIGIIPQTLGRIDTFTEFIHSECYQMSGDSSVPNAASLALLPIPQGLCETMNEDENPRFLWKFGNGWEREGFPGGASGKEAFYQCRGRRDDAGSTLGLGRSPAGAHSDPPQCPCLKNPGQRGRAGYGPWGRTAGRAWGWEAGRRHGVRGLGRAEAALCLWPPKLCGGRSFPFSLLMASGQRGAPEPDLWGCVWRACRGWQSLRAETAVWELLAV